MKNFFKLVTANVVAILIIFALFILGFFFFVVLSTFSSNEKVSLKDNSILTINLKDGVMESSSEASISLFNIGEEMPTKYLDILRAIEYAKTDDHIKGISIETDDANAGITQIDDIRAALEDFKKSGKFIYAYGNTMSQSAYYLASVADKSFLHPAGGIELKGLASEVIYFKDFLDKIGIGVDVIRHGKYKSAVEPFLTDKISEENKEQLSFMLNDIWGNVSKKIETSRNIDSISFKNIVDSLNGIIPELALKGKLIDQLLQKSEYNDLLKEKIKVDSKENLNTISLQKYITAVDLDAKGDKNSQIAILNASGEIFSGKGNDGIYSENFIHEIKKLKNNDKIKAVVLRVNSPGGSANASDEILFELKELQKEKPLIVSMGDYAASGGYYISMAGQKIFSEPNTLTGSIGVFGIVPNAKNLATRNKLRSDVVATNENSNMLSAIQGMTPGTREIMQKSIEQTYKRFVHFVSENRNKSFEQVDEIGGGHVWSGQRAKSLGLVDELGSLNDAIKFAAKEAKLKDYSVKSYPKDKTPLESFFESFNNDDLATKAIERKFGKENSQLLESLLNPNRKGTQMMMPYQLSLDF